jgi:hypothetical protein
MNSRCILLMCFLKDVKERSYKKTFCRNQNLFQTKKVGELFYNFSFIALKFNKKNVIYTPFMLIICIINIVV